jgi:hypothetical protein
VDLVSIIGETAVISKEYSRTVYEMVKVYGSEVPEQVINMKVNM